MKLHILSDLHLSVQCMDRPRTDADVVVLAGDIHRPATAIEWALGFGQPVIYVPGNHEFYGASLPAAVRELRQLSEGTHVHVLDNRALELRGVRFLGSTLWTDFRIVGDGERQAHAMAEALKFNRDFSRIRVDEPPGDRVFAPQDCAALFADSARWLDEALSRPHAGPTVVVTHHAPSPQSIPLRFAGSPLNANFVSDAEWLLQGRRARLWIHGHLHDSFDYEVDGTRVVCNPRGYAKGGVAENPRFDPYLTVDIA
ncbi:MAG TPA: metallophosphoesterase [Candidatus Desulfobacillus denitrificans]|nr:metallophosphoesterase [Candidatus Desulfobacillus denitrificans]HNT61788.1 metallophosphoesterase [Candidatus Desulfobacillus denitrificans]